MKQKNNTYYIQLLFLVVLLVFPSCDTQIDDDLKTALEQGNVFEAEETTYTYPIADAGNDASIEIDGVVPLDGSGSSDVDGDTLTYEWRILGRPPGSIAELSDETDIAPTFTADTAGEYVLELTVNDGTETSTDTMIVTVVEVDPPPPVKREDEGDDLLDSIDTCFISALSGK